jgi:predicted alpha/beta superfamily hydrolase
MKGRSLPWLVSSMALLFGLGRSLVAQRTHDPVSIGTYRTFYSEVLDEERVLLLHLPRGYEDSGRSYPVIYMLYGDLVTTYFAEVVSSLDRLSSAGRIPGMILIGIMNTDRYRDLLPERDGQPTGIRDFLRFFTDELFPHVEKTWRTKSFRILIGPQAAANFALYTMMTFPDLFDAFIINSPFRWRGGRDLMADMAGPFFKARKPFRRFMYITYDDSDELGREGRPYIERLAETVKSADPEGFRLITDYIRDNDEFLTPLGFHKGIKSLFNDYPFPEGMQVDALQDILGFYTRLSKEYGFTVDVPDHVLTMQSDSLMDRGKTDEMLEVLHFMLEADPRSTNALWRLGNHSERIGELEKAVETYQRMIKFMGSDAGMITGRIEQLKKKIEARRKK